MTSETKAKIFLADERGCTETGWFRSYNTFNFGKYQNEFKQPFEGLCVLKDDTLSGGKSFKLTIEETTLVLLLPIVGAVSFKDSNRKEGIVNSRELQLLYSIKASTIELSNPYENDLINFLQLWIKLPVSSTESISELLPFNLDENRNQLIPISANSTSWVGDEASHPTIKIGKFTGREEAVYKTSNKQNSVFVFVIQGAFEVQGRLLHARDGLALWNEPNDIELEALSNDAIVVFIEQF